jgi:AraC-like DNA-binding protein
VPARALWNTSLEAGDVVGRAGAELHARLQEVASWPDRFAVVDEVLCRLLVERDPVPPEVREAWRVLVASGGRVPVTELAAHVGWSRRHLAGRFGDELGLGPKLAARVVRFERARRLLEHPARPSLAEVAAVCGYYDQPHLNRDFLALAGCPPLAWLDEELPSVQDGASVGGARSSHD